MSGLTAADPTQPLLTLRPGCRNAAGQDGDHGLGLHHQANGNQAGLGHDQDDHEPQAQDDPGYSHLAHLSSGKHACPVKAP